MSFLWLRPRDGIGVETRLFRGFHWLRLHRPLSFRMGRVWHLSWSGSFGRLRPVHQQFRLDVVVWVFLSVCDPFRGCEACMRVMPSSTGENRRCHGSAGAVSHSRNSLTAFVARIMPPREIRSHHHPWSRLLTPGSSLARRQLYTVSFCVTRSLPHFAHQRTRQLSSRRPIAEALQRCDPHFITSSASNPRKLTPSQAREHPSIPRSHCRRSDLEGHLWSPPEAMLPFGSHGLVLYSADD